MRNDGSGPGYGVEVDCWSIGAVLYVMLVARFPEFDRSSGSPVVKLHGHLWERVSVEARDLIRKLMMPDPTMRMAVSQALQHPWALNREMSRSDHGRDSVTPASTTLEEPYDTLIQGVDQMSTEDRPPVPHSLVPLAGEQRRHAGAESALVPARRPLHRNETGFLIVLHMKVSKLFAAALRTYQDPSISLKIRERAFLGRSQLEDTVMVLRKLDTLSNQIVDGLHDVMKAVKEDIPVLAHNILELQREWVTNLRQQMLQVKESNTALMQSLNCLIAEIEVAPQSMASEDIESADDSVEQAMTPLPVLRMQGDYDALVQRMRDTDHFSGDQLLDLLLPTVETSPPPSPTRANPTGADDHALSPLHHLSFLLQQVRLIYLRSSRLFFSLIRPTLIKNDTLNTD